MARGAVKEAVLRYMRDNPGIYQTIGDVAEDTGYDRQRVAGTLSRLTAEMREVARVNRGTYVYHPGGNGGGGKTPTAQLFELIGQTSDGRFVLRNEDGSELLAATSL